MRTFSPSIPWAWDGTRGGEKCLQESQDVVANSRCPISACHVKAGSLWSSSGEFGISREF